MKQYLLAVAMVIVIALASFKRSAYSMTQPRMRVNRTASLTVTTAWQKIDFSGTSTYDINTFQLDPNGSGNPLVYWDPTNKIFKFYNTTDVNYFCYLTGATTTNLITTQAQLRYRITVPNGVSPGVDIHFPNPDGLGYSNLKNVTTLTTSDPFDKSIPVYISQSVRTNGFYIEVELSNALITLGTTTLDNCSFLVQTETTQN